MSNAPPPSGSRPPRQTRTGTTATGARKAASKSVRSRAREFALQGLYQHLVGGNPAADIDTFTRDLAGFHKADAAHFDALLHGCIEQAADRSDSIPGIEGDEGPRRAAEWPVL